VLWVDRMIGPRPAAVPEQPKTPSMVAERGGGRWSRASAGSSSGSASAAAASGPGTLPTGIEPGPEGATVPRWAQLIRHLLRLRRLQRILHHLGEFLKTQVCPATRSQLSSTCRPSERRR
jgi:hypothetical protein